MTLSKNFFDEDSALSDLLKDGVLFSNSRKYVDLDIRGEGIKEETIVLFVIANDVFVPAADATNLTLKELPLLYSLWKEHKEVGVWKWLMIKTNCRPRKLVEKRIRDTGLWEKKFDKLPPNSFD